MKTLQYLAISMSIFISGILSTYAACDGWFSFGSDCETKPVYCQNGECTLANGVTATATAVGNQITTRPLSQYIQDIVSYFLTFVSIVAVLYIIYAGFLVMTGAGDEEKLKKMKNIVLYVVIGILLMWLSYGIVKWVINLTSPATAWGQSNIQTTWSIVPEVSAYTESSADTFQDYQGQIRVAIQNLEAELRVNGKVAVTSIENIKNLVQIAYDRLPDSGDYATINSTAKRAVDMYLDIASKNPSSTQKVGDAISKTSAFLDGAKIDKVTGTISATPGEGNAPLTVSFLATDVVDPSGTTPSSNNYVWWIRENGGVRRELGRGASLMYTFNQEGTFTVNLDVVSGSRNSKGKTDVLPLSISKSISVKPKLGEIVLLVNGVNVSNLDNIKISPTIGKMGIIFDATASRAIGNGSITKTSWKFGNGNEMSYPGKPVVERQIYGNQGNYTVELDIETNDGKKINKKFQLIVRDPSAVVQLDNEISHVGEVVHVSALSYFTSSNNNTEYSWQIQNDDNQKVLKSAAGKSLDYTFDAIGKYIITLTARSANGSVDSDSRTITVESKNPIANLDTPSPISKEKPNTFLFNATKSYDPDSKSSAGLTYSWKLDEQKVDLNNVTDNGARGTITFDAIGTHTISLTVANAFGKISTVEKTFTVDSVLSVDMLITPQVAPIGNIVTFIARSENAEFYEWSFGDGTPTVSGGNKIVQHAFNKTGNYTVILTVSTKDGGKSNQAQRKIYITDTGSPFAIINIANTSNSAYEDSTACSSGATIVNRSEQTTFDGAKSVNIDGSNGNLTYTWSYLGKTKTSSSFSERFGELGCFPIKLTVRSNKNGATSSATQMLYLKNQPPEFTSISTNVDTSKKDSQKVLVKVTANGAKDPDGVITSYIWYYTTESDKEPQNVQITQKPEITFVLPNITEKYYFGVILEDNDGARINSADNSSEQTPLILTNENGNIYLPLITLSTPKSAVTTGENVHLTVIAKTIVGTDITNKAEYAWDFDGDGKIDQKTQTPTVDHVYENSGDYTVKVRVTYNGVSNTKYQTIYVKNVLKAHAHGYHLPNGSYYFLNSSEGVYDKALWSYSGGSITSPYSVVMESNTIINNGVIGKLTVSNNDSDISSTDIKTTDIEEVKTSSGLVYQSSPQAKDDIIHLSGSSEKVLISMLGNNGNTSHYAIDTDTSIDSDLDGVSDNDVDNKSLPSYDDGSVFVLKDFNPSHGREQKVKLTLFQGSTPVDSRTITLVFDYVSETTTGSGTDLSNVDSGSMSTFDKDRLDQLASLIRSIDDTNRVVFMKSYNNLVENWGDTFTKSKTLIDLQSLVDESSITADKKAAITTVINDLLSGESQATDDITLAARLISGLVSKSPNAPTLTEKLTAIESHPQSFGENLTLAKEIFDIVQSDTSIDDGTKGYIYNQLSVIKSGGTQNVPQESIQTPTSSTGGGVLGFISGVVKIFFLIIGIILVVILVGYVLYRVSRKNSAIGFQDFLIDSIFHAKKTNTIPTDTISTTVPTVIKEQEQPRTTEAPSEKLPTANIPVVDPMTVLEQESSATPPPVPKIPVSAPESLIIDSSPVIIPEESTPFVEEQKEDALAQQEPETTSQDVLITPLEEASSEIPDWLKIPGTAMTTENDDTSEKTAENPVQEEVPVAAMEVTAIESDSDVPTWLKESATIEETINPSDSPSVTTQDSGTSETETISPVVDTTAETTNSSATDSSQSTELPDWLVDSVKQEAPVVNELSKEEKKDRAPKKKTKKVSDAPAPIKSQSSDTKTDTSGTTDNIPDWLK